MAQAMVAFIAWAIYYIYCIYYYLKNLCMFGRGVGGLSKYIASSSADESPGTHVWDALHEPHGPQEAVPAGIMSMALTALAKLRYQLGPQQMACMCAALQVRPSPTARTVKCSYSLRKGINQGRLGTTSLGHRCLQRAFI